MSSRVIHWLPQSLTEGSVTACGLDVEAHPRITWLTAQNEVTCKRCLNVHNVPEIEV
jgi:hypothetical protein